MSIRVLRPGLLDTLQDLGRNGYARWGINPCGVMDTYATRIANALVGNPLHEAVLEMHFPACELQFECDLLISITGADFDATLNSDPISGWKPVLVKQDSTLRFMRRRWGSRCYIAVRGGFDIPLWLGSKSTHLKAGAGGYEGRRLRKDDRLDVVPAPGLSVPRPLRENSVLPWSVNHVPAYASVDGVCFIEGHEWTWLSGESRQFMKHHSFSVASKSDRMAYYLLHPPLSLIHNTDLVSSAVTFGTMQLLRDGQLIVLMADHQTTGGYPRIGHVVSAHLPLLAQISPGEMFTFKNVSIETAEHMLVTLDKEVDMLRQACQEKLETYYAEH